MQPEKHSFFRHLNPFKRSLQPESSQLQYACTGLRTSCELCPSFVSESEDIAHLGEWVIDLEERDRITAATDSHDWLVPARMDLFTSDLVKGAQNLASAQRLIDNLSKESDQRFFICTKNLIAMSEVWYPANNITWGYSAATQEELNFYSTVRFSAIDETDVTEALFLDPLIEEVVIPENFLHHFKFIFVDGYRGTGDYPFKLEWLQAIADQLTEVGSETKLIIEGIGDFPTYKGDSFKTRRKKLSGQSISDLLLT